MTVALPAPRTTRRRTVIFPLGYGALALLGLVLLGARGEARLLVPLTPLAARLLPALALDGRTQLLGTGLLPGSLVVRRDGGDHAGLLRHGIVTIPVAVRGCGA